MLIPSTCSQVVFFSKKTIKSKLGLLSKLFFAETSMLVASFFSEKIVLSKLTPGVALEYQSLYTSSTTLHAFNKAFVIKLVSGTKNVFRKISSNTALSVLAELCERRARLNDFVTFSSAETVCRQLFNLPYKLLWCFLLFIPSRICYNLPQIHCTVFEHLLRNLSSILIISHRLIQRFDCFNQHY